MKVKSKSAIRETFEVLTNETLKTKEALAKIRSIKHGVAIMNIFALIGVTLVVAGLVVADINNFNWLGTLFTVSCIAVTYFFGLAMYLGGRKL